MNTLATFLRPARVFLALAAFTAAVAPAQAQQAKNVILMISDGMGFNTVQATNYYTGTTAVYQSGTSNGWVNFGMQTYSAGLRPGNEGSDVAYTGQPYDPSAMASDFDYARGNGTQYGTAGATDSASAATALYTGVKVYDGEINYTTDNKPLTTFFEYAAMDGRNIGAVSSVQISHATPGAVYGHNSSRNNYSAIAYEGIKGSNPLDNQPNNGTDATGSHLAGDNDNYNSLNYYNNMVVLAGAGSGDHDDNGVSANKTDKYVGGQDTWTEVKSTTPPNGWDLVQSTSEFSDVANGAANPDKLLGVANVNGTLQQSRAPGDDYNGDGNGPANDWGGLTGAARTAAINADILAAPVNAGLNTGVPTLETMTDAAMNVLDNNPNGFAVMIEGGATDWAGHANQMNRMIEEQMDFNAAVEAVSVYLDNNTNGNNWDNTLLIVTADHETGFLMGDDGATAGYFDVNGDGAYQDGVDYAYIGDSGSGNLPEYQFYSGIHSNQLVPVYMKGAGADQLSNWITMAGTDANLADYYNLDPTVWDGSYIDNTDIYKVMVGAAGIPEPGTASLIVGSLAGLAVLRRRRRG